MQVQNIQDAISIRPTTIDDANQIFNLISQNRVSLCKQFPWNIELESTEQEQSFLKYALHKVENGSLYLASVFVDERLVGQIDIHNIDQANKRGELGFWLDKRAQGFGIMTYAVRSITEVAFSDLGLHRLELYVDIDNDGSQGVARRLSWKKEALLKDYLFTEDGYHDVILFSKINYTTL